MAVATSAVSRDVTGLEGGGVVERASFPVDRRVAPVRAAEAGQSTAR
ncbi:hypothetical protein LV78_006315 [Actinosynnema pretiosum]|nr:hypothetical protein [Actinosynnema pretiosum]